MSGINDDSSDSEDMLIVAQPTRTPWRLDQLYKTPYMLFMDEMKPAEQEQHPDADKGTVATIVRDRWDQLEEDDKRRYIDKSEEDRREFLRHVHEKYGHYDSVKWSAKYRSWMFFLQNKIVQNKFSALVCHNPVLVKCDTFFHIEDGTEIFTPCYMVSGGLGESWNKPFAIYIGYESFKLAYLMDKDNVTQNFMNVMGTDCWYKFDSILDRTYLEYGVEDALSDCVAAARELYDSLVEKNLPLYIKEVSALSRYAVSWSGRATHMLLDADQVMNGQFYHDKPDGWDELIAGRFPIPPGQLDKVHAAWFPIEKLAPEPEVEMERPDIHFSVDGETRTLCEWQKSGYYTLMHDDSDRNIHWIFSRSPDMGKTNLGKCLQSKGACKIDTCLSEADVKKIISKYAQLVIDAHDDDDPDDDDADRDKLLWFYENRVIVLDIVRMQIPKDKTFAMLESIKHSFVAKNGKAVLWWKPPKILVFSNDTPVVSDIYQVYHVHGDTAFTATIELFEKYVTLVKEWVEGLKQEDVMLHKQSEVARQCMIDGTDMTEEIFKRAFKYEKEEWISLKDMHIELKKGGWESKEKLVGAKNDDLLEHITKYWKGRATFEKPKNGDNKGTKGVKGLRLRKEGEGDSEDFESFSEDD